MKNHRGEIATLLTLGLVLVGTVVTIATSLIANNQKNIASNPRAATTYSCCKVYETSSLCSGGKRIVNMGNTYSSTCAANNLVDCASVGGPTASGASICPAAGAGGGTGGATLPACEYNLSLAKVECGTNNYTSDGCKAGTYKCKGAPAVSPPPATIPFTCSTGSPQSGTSAETCSDICAPNNYVSGSQKVDGSTRNCCCSQGGGSSNAGETITPDRLCCRLYSCNQYGAPAGQRLVKVVGYTGTHNGTAGYTSCATTAYPNTQQCSTIPGAPTTNGADGFVSYQCDGGGTQPGGGVDPGLGSGGGGTQPGGANESCCLVYKQGLYASTYGCDSTQYAAKVVGFTGVKENGSVGYTSCATTGYEKYSGTYKVDSCANISGAESLASSGTGSICIGDPDTAPAPIDPGPIGSGTSGTGEEGQGCFSPYSNPANPTGAWTCKSPLECSTQNSSGFCQKKVANTNTCATATSLLHEYRCVNNIQVSNGNLDADKSCGIAFSNSTYDSSLSCGSSGVQVCCKRRKPIDLGSIVINPIAPVVPGVEDFDPVCRAFTCPAGTNGSFWGRTSRSGAYEYFPKATDCENPDTTGTLYELIKKDNSVCRPGLNLNLGDLDLSNLTIGSGGSGGSGGGLNGDPNAVFSFDSPLGGQCRTLLDSIDVSIIDSGQLDLNVNCNATPVLVDNKLLCCN